MKGVIRDTGLDNLLRVLIKQDSALPAQHSPWWPRSYDGTTQQNASKKATLVSEITQNSLVLEKESVFQPSENTCDGLERGVAEKVVDWYGPNDSEVLVKSSPRQCAANPIT